MTSHLTVVLSEQNGDLVGLVSFHGKEVFAAQKLFVSNCPNQSFSKVKYLRSQDRTLRISAHHYKRGGASHLCFTGDSQRLLSTGADGVLACWVWNFTSTGNIQSSRACELTNLLAIQGD